MLKIEEIDRKRSLQCFKINQVFARFCLTFLSKHPVYKIWGFWILQTLFQCYRNIGCNYFFTPSPILFSTKFSSNWSLKYCCEWWSGASTDSLNCQLSSSVQVRSSLFSSLQSTSRNFQSISECKLIDLRSLFLLLDYIMWSWIDPVFFVKTFFSRKIGSNSLLLSANSHSSHTHHIWHCKEKGSKRFNLIYISNYCSALDFLP